MTNEALYQMASSIIIGWFLGLVLMIVVTGVTDLIRFIRKKHKQRNAPNDESEDLPWKIKN